MKKTFTDTMDALLDGFEPQDKLAVAVSGGADSMALLDLARLYAKERGMKLTALTVDHGLRAGSAEEAKKVGAWCTAHAIQHHILVWQGDKPATGIQDAARDARRRLLCDACYKNGIEVLLLGHQADDQAETILMRLQRGTGLRGLLGMRDVTHDDATEVTILRPLLSLRRKDLRDYCVQNAISFVDDPSNDDPAFERVRVRKALEALPELAHGIRQTIDRLTECDETFDMLAAEWLEENIEPIDTNSLWIPDEFLETLYPPVQLRILEGALLEVMPDTATLHDIPLDGLERLRDALQDKGFKGQTLADIAIKPHNADGVGGLLLSRAAARRQK